ncbi:MAG: penicillin-binding protein 2 [Ignavibacteriales bacterium]
MNDKVLGSAIRLKIFSILLFFFFSASFFQLFKMQIINQQNYETKSNENSIKEVQLVPPRGLFYDRYFNLIVGNKSAFTLEIIPAFYNQKNDAIIEKVLEVPPGYIKKIFSKDKNYSKFLPRRIMRGLSPKFIAWFEENKSQLKGVNYISEMQRDYSYGINGSHMFGYTKEISSEQLKLFKGIYDMGDYVGNNGIEKTYEMYLHGIKGAKLFMVDSKQQVIGRYENGEQDIAPRKGYDLVLTIDKDAQKAAEESFVDKKGGLVAIEPSTGEILAFVSAPEYDLSTFASFTSGNQWLELLKDPDKPMFNRASMSQLPPGSTFKMIGAIAALEEGIIDTNFTINCGGGFQFGNRFFKCTHVHGGVNVKSAIEKSCNTFFYQMILKIGFEKWSEYGKKFGFGEKTGVDISEEAKGIMPSPSYFNKVYGEKGWTQGYVVSLGIGQGEVSATPLQLAKYCALLANFGKTKTPHFLKGFVRNDNNEFIPSKYKEIDIGISRKTMKIVREGMFRVVNGAGTATHIKIDGITIAGKTGTAQNPHGKDHAIFIGFAPYDNPKIAIACVVENAGYGATYAAPIVKNVIEAYLKKNEIKKNELIAQKGNE